ncbi:MAG: response regulator transcription factor [Clostridiales bacterium]|jgi:two-component system response regulator ResD|nr:response regulator transcription factor [Clostridiales bacterium]
MYKLLIVDDEEMIRRLIAKYAVFEGHTVAEAADGMQAVQMCKEEKFDLMICDIMMPELDGFSACREIRKFSDIPIIMLSARGEEYDKINGFGLGIDDYVVKPFSPKELMLRVDAVLHRYHTAGAARKEASSGQIFQLEGLRIDLAARIVYVDEARVELSPKEYDLLFYMIENKNIALSREKLITQVWGYDYYGDDRTLDTHIKLLRKSLGPYAKFIVTLRGVGYRFDTES